MRRIFHAGELAYMDSFAGLVPVKVLSVQEPGSGAYVAKGNLMIKVTAKRPGYQRGAILDGLPASHVVPREMVMRHSGKYFINVEYRWE